MKTPKLFTVNAALVGVALVIAGCDSGGSGGTVASEPGQNQQQQTENNTPVVQPLQQTEVTATDAAIVRKVVKQTGGNDSIVRGNFNLPPLAGALGNMTMTIPANPTPEFSARRTAVANNGQQILMGDPVIIRYDMFSWADGRLIDTSERQTAALTVRAGIIDGSAPDYVAEAVLGRNIGDTVQIVVPGDDESLPLPMQVPGEAYVLVMQLM